VPYYCKTWLLKTFCDGKPDMRTIINAKHIVIAEMKRLQLTHVLYVAFNPSPVIMPDFTPRYRAFVRGARLKPWDFTLRMDGPKSYDACTA
jgi:hypothetical protein